MSSRDLQFQRKRESENSVFLLQQRVAIPGQLIRSRSFSPRIYWHVPIFCFLLHQNTHLYVQRIYAVIYIQPRSDYQGSSLFLLRPISRGLYLFWLTPKSLHKLRALYTYNGDAADHESGLGEYTGRLPSTALLFSSSLISFF